MAELVNLQELTEVKQTCLETRQANNQIRTETAFLITTNNNNSTLFNHVKHLGAGGSVYVYVN